MFVGQYEHQLEAKNRLSIPKKYRSQLEAGAILCQGLDGCLFLYPKSTWDALLTKLQSLSLTKSDARDFVRLFSFGASVVEIDRLGRTLIPEYLKRYAGIDEVCVIAGAIDRIEIWAKSKFDVYINRVNSQAEAIAEKIDIP